MPTRKQRVERGRNDFLLPDDDFGDLGLQQTQSWRQLIEHLGGIRFEGGSRDRNGFEDGRWDRNGFEGRRRHRIGLEGGRRYRNGWRISLIKHKLFSCSESP